MTLQLKFRAIAAGRIMLAVLVFLTPQAIAGPAKKQPPASTDKHNEVPTRPWDEIVSADYRKKGGGVLLPPKMRETLRLLLRECPRAPVIPRSEAHRRFTVSIPRPAKRVFYQVRGFEYRDALFIQDGTFHKRTIPSTQQEPVRTFCRELDALWATSRKPVRKK